MVLVFLRNNNMEWALRSLKKKRNREGLVREDKLHAYYEKPGDKRRRKRKEARIRQLKKARRRALQESGTVTGHKASSAA
jgi:small subunit ribosomal protein S21